MIFFLCFLEVIWFQNVISVFTLGLTSIYTFYSWLILNSIYQTCYCFFFFSVFGHLGYKPYIYFLIISKSIWCKVYKEILEHFGEYFSIVWESVCQTVEVSHYMEKISNSGTRTWNSFVGRILIVDTIYSIIRGLLRFSRDLKNFCIILYNFKFISIYFIYNIMCFFRICSDDPVHIYSIDKVCF